MVVYAVYEGGVVIKQILLERLTQARAGELSLRSAGAHLEGGDGLGLAVNVGVNQLEVGQSQIEIFIFIFLSEC